MPREYDREFTKVRTDRTRIRVAFSTERGDVVRFLVQLEYHLESGWVEVVRFDHDPAGELGHDVTREGVHMDVYREGEKLRTEEVFPPMPPGNALATAEDHLSEHAERYLDRYRRWHEIDDESR